MPHTRSTHFAAIAAPPPRRHRCALLPLCTRGHGAHQEDGTEIDRGRPPSSQLATRAARKISCRWRPKDVTVDTSSLDGFHWVAKSEVEDACNFAGFQYSNDVELDLTPAMRRQLQAVAAGLPDASALEAALKGGSPHVHGAAIVWSASAAVTNAAAS